MNNCVFYGVVCNPVLSDDGAKRVVFDLHITTNRKTKTGKLVKDRVLVPCEAWDSAAEVITNHCNERFILVRASVKNTDGGILFRVNEFFTGERGS